MRIHFHSPTTNSTSAPCLSASSTTGFADARHAEIARAFQRGIAQGLFAAIRAVCEEHGIPTVVLSGGVFQNELLLEDLKPLLESEKLQVWTNHAVPPNDGGISLGQAALAAFEMDAADGAPYA